jgi:hypothetical protein
MSSTETYDILDSIMEAGDVVEEARVFDGNKLIQESYSSVTVGKRAIISHVHKGTKCCGFNLTIEDI